LNAQSTRIKIKDQNIRMTLQSMSFIISFNGAYWNIFCRFIDSEADLDSAIKGLLPISQSPSLAFQELVRSGAIALLVGLLTHENMDIVIDVVELVYELTDEDASVEEDDEDHETAEDALKILVEALVSSLMKVI
jgi:beta-catenin-like protein 1